ncbi:MAG: tetratricopeptide repeat protein [Pseudomonadota bacterium]|nr:tetratricopeptide repeat protein [Pseudomonadota bacterium]
MDVYRTEEQQIEAMKKWWQKNGTSILTGIIVALVAVLGWNFYQQNQQANREAAAVLYSQLVEAATLADQYRIAGNTEQLEGQLATVTHLGKQLKNDFTGNEYAVFGAMMLAREAMFDNDPAAAEQQLQWAAANTSSDPTRLIATQRLARVQAEQEKYDAALATLDEVEPGSQADAFEEVRGDIYLAMGERDKARSAYKKAIDLSTELNQGQPRPILEFKYNNLLVAG